MRLSKKIEERFIAGPSPRDILENAKSRRYFEMLFCSPEANVLFDLWCDEMSLDHLPTRKSIETKKLMPLGGSLMVMKKIAPGNWIISFAGNAVVEVFGEEVTGKASADVVLGYDAEKIMEKEQFVDQNLCPYLEIFAIEEGEAQYIMTSLILPMFNPDSNDIDCCFVYIDKLEMAP